MTDEGKRSRMFNDTVYSFVTGCISGAIAAYVVLLIRNALA